MVDSRRSAAATLVMCVGVALAGCSPPTTTEPIPPPIPPPIPTPAASRQVDLLRLGIIASAFPPGYPANTPVRPPARDAQASEAVGDLVSYGEPLTATPEPCRTLLKPVEAKSPTDWAAVTSTTNATDPFISVSAYDPVSMPAALPSGCDRFSFVVEGGGVPDGKAERLPVPTFDNAVTSALKVVFVVDDSTVAVPLVEYFYTAVLDGRTLVELWARVPSNFSAEPILPILLTKAVAALRGQ